MAHFNMKSAGALILLLAVTVCFAESSNRKPRQYNLKAASVLYDVKKDPANVYNNQEYAYKVEPVVPSKTTYQEATYGCCPTKVPYRYEASPGYPSETPTTYTANAQYPTPNNQYNNDQYRAPEAPKDKPYPSNTYEPTSKAAYPTPNAYESNPSSYTPTSSYVAKPSMPYAPTDAYKAPTSNSYTSNVDYQAPNTPSPYNPTTSYGAKPSLPYATSDSYKAPGSNSYPPSSNVAYQVQKPPTVYSGNPSAPYNPSQSAPFTIAVYPEENTQAAYSSQPAKPYASTPSYSPGANQYKEAFPSTFYPDNIQPVDFANAYANTPNIYNQQLRYDNLYDGANYVDDYYTRPPQPLVNYGTKNYQDGSRKNIQYDNSQRDYNRPNNYRKSTPVNKYPNHQNQCTMKYDQPARPSYGYTVPKAKQQPNYGQSYSQAANPSQYTSQMVYASNNPTGTTYTVKIEGSNSNQGSYTSMPTYQNANPSPVYKPTSYANEKPYVDSVYFDKPYTQQGSYSTAVPYDKQETQYGLPSLTDNRRIYATSGPYARKTTSYLPPPTGQYKRTIDVEAEEAQNIDNATVQAATVETSTAAVVDASTPVVSTV